jgi:predicted PhzF superfamily epimerase YddE/YHI9
MEMKLHLTEIREELKKSQQEVRDLRNEQNAISRTQAKKLDIIIQYVEEQCQESSEVLPTPASTEEELSELLEHDGLVSSCFTVLPGTNVGAQLHIIIPVASMNHFFSINSDFDALQKFH